jgi:enolase
MSEIQSLRALEILDSRGNPTLQVAVKTRSGVIGKACVPSGASTGQKEAVEKRDGDLKRFFGKGVKQAISLIEGEIFSLLKGRSILDQEAIDQLLIQADGTPQKSRLGANTLLGVSLSIAHAAAKFKKMALYQSLKRDSGPLVLPCPMMNIINGGMHADNNLNFQEFMIRPKGAPNFREALRWGVEIFHILKSVLRAKGYPTAVGDEGGFAPSLSSHEEALDLILHSIEKAGYRAGEEIALALDCAASEFYDSKAKLYMKNKKGRDLSSKDGRDSFEQIDYLVRLTEKYPIDSIEDPLDENDWEGWTEITRRLNHIQIVGDDLFTTNVQYLKKGIREKAANAILIKPNQIGTLSETLHTIDLAQKEGYRTVVSHRSGETSDTTIADIAVARGCGQIKTGSLCRGERVAKYNRLLEIEDDLKENPS